MVQSLSVHSSSVLLKDHASFTKPLPAYSPFSLGFCDAQRKKPQLQAGDAQASATPAAKVHVLVALDALQTSGPLPAEGADWRPPQKNTFIHFDVPDSRVSTLTKEQIAPWRSAPCLLQTVPYRTKYPDMEPAHLRHECKPCAYHVQKGDGCRWGERCSFCHLCPTGEIKRRKKAKVHAIKVQGIRARKGDARRVATEQQEQNFQ